MATPANKPGFPFQQRMDGNSQMAKPSTAGNRPMKPPVPNAHKQPPNGVAALQQAMFARGKTSGGGRAK